MKNYKKQNAFTVIEVIISMALIGILSIGVYNAYLMIIKQTKSAEVKQSVVLHGRETLEMIIDAIESDEIIYSDEINNSKLEIDNIITLYSINNNTDSFYGIRYLDKQYELCGEDESKYIEEIKLEKIKANLGEESYENINLDRNDYLNINNHGNKLFISKEKKNGQINDYLNDKKIEIGSDKLILNIYIEEKNIEVKDAKGNKIYNDIANISNGKINIIINFNNYNKIEDSNINDVKVNIYNRDKDIPNIYIEKPIDLKVDTIAQKGKINLYDNRGGIGNNIKFGFLYDIRVTITDKNNANNILFTANSKQNIDIK